MFKSSTIIRGARFESFNGQCNIFISYCNPAFKEASAGILKHIFSHTILMIARILFLLLYFDRIEDNLANATAYIYHKTRKRQTSVQRFNQDVLTQ